MTEERQLKEAIKMAVDAYGTNVTEYGELSIIKTLRVMQRALPDLPLAIAVALIGVLYSENNTPGMLSSAGFSNEAVSCATGLQGLGYVPWVYMISDNTDNPMALNALDLYVADAIKQALLSGDIDKYNDLLLVRDTLTGARGTVAVGEFNPWED